MYNQKLDLRGHNTLRAIILVLIVNCFTGCYFHKVSNKIRTTNANEYLSEKVLKSIELAIKQGDKHSNAIKRVVKLEKYDYVICTVDTAIYKKEADMGYIVYELNFFKHDKTWIDGAGGHCLFYDDKIIIYPPFKRFDELRGKAEKLFNEFADNSNNVFTELELEYIEERFWKMIPFSSIVGPQRNECKLTKGVFSNQKPYKFKEKGPNLFLTDKKGNHLDTIMNMTSGEDIKVFFLDERIFKVDALSSMRSISTFIEEYYIDNSKFILKRNIHLKTDGCLDKSYHKLKIKIKKGRIIWKIRQNRKTYRGEYTLKEFETLNVLELPESICDEYYPTF